MTSGLVSADPEVEQPEAGQEIVEEALSDPGEPRLRGRARRQSSPTSVIIEWLLIISLAVGVAMLVRGFVVQTFFIPSPSMTPTLNVHDRLLVDKVTLSAREIRRGDIIVFRRPEGFNDPTIKDLIKRVIGLPGDTVEGRDGTVWVNGKALPEPYLPKGRTTEPFAPAKVAVDNYFVMGDNRAQSYDSRFWGTVERESVIGRALVRVWPISRIGRI